MVTAPHKKASESDAIAPQSAPPPSLFGYGDPSSMNGFIWQQLSEIQKSLGAIQEAQKSLGSAQDKADEKVSGKLKKIDEDLIEIKQIRHTAKWLFRVSVTVGTVLLAVMGFVVSEVWSIAKPAVLDKLKTHPVTQQVLTSK